MRTTSTISSKSATARNSSMYKDIEENSGCLEFGVCVLISGLSIFFIVLAQSYQQTGSISRLYLGVGASIVVILLYVISIWRYIIIRYRIRKQIKVKYGSINRKIFKEKLNKNKYYSWFIAIIAGLTMPLFGVLFFSVFIYLISGVVITDTIEVVFMLFYMPADFFFGNETEIVTYIDESKYIYPKSSKRRSSTYSIYSYYVVNFQTSGGELLSLIVDKDNLAEVRSYNNTEIKYIARTGVYVP